MLNVRRVAVGISGGVDSAVTALLLKKQGFDVVGIFMKNWDLPDETGICKISEDFKDARYVCDKLKIPLKEVDFVKPYWNEVFSYMTEEYEKGFTPNPDVMCNKRIKFRLFFDYAMNKVNADAIATGHYACSSFGPYLERYDPSKKAKLLKSKDENKDQTLFLSQISQEALRKSMFPVGIMTKDVVKKIAFENDLAKIAKKRESTGICFIGKRDFQHFFSNYLKPKPGKFLNLETGKIEGTHQGRHLWTIGQSTRISGCKEALYVADKSDERDILVVRGLEHSALLTDFFFTEKPHWIADGPENSDFVVDCHFRFQHRKPLTRCKLVQVGANDWIVRIENPLIAITPGQYAVFYSNEECLGSAKILRTGPSYFILKKDIPEGYLEYPDDQTLKASSVSN